ncbi:hypothetical protein AB1Y20_011995 [Prymnesium parvum]|uniref:DNA 3'-5' helicase n=1 Tax=Prymnesium parvum TaxID=97485 RepID=A0AB34IQT5_PRYPA
MDELATLRLQIKAFQSSFIEWNGRPPSSSDLQPAMRAAYARYKELKQGKPQPQQHAKAGGSPLGTENAGGNSSRGGVGDGAGAARAAGRGSTVERATSEGGSASEHSPGQTSKGSGSRRRGADERGAVVGGAHRRARLGALRPNRANGGALPLEPWKSKRERAPSPLAEEAMDEGREGVKACASSDGVEASRGAELVSSDGAETPGGGAHASSEGSAGSREGETNVGASDREERGAANGSRCAAPAEAEVAVRRVECCEELGCRCLVPGKDCGFRWQKASAYEAQRLRAKQENEAQLRALGLLPPAAAGGSGAGKKGRADSDDSGEEEDGAPVGCGSGKEAAVVAPAAARSRGSAVRRRKGMNDNFIKISLNRSYAGRGGVRGKKDAQGGSKRARADRQRRVAMRRKGTLADARETNAAPPLHAGGAWGCEAGGGEDELRTKEGEQEAHEAARRAVWDDLPEEQRQVLREGVSVADEARASCDGRVSGEGADGAREHTEESSAAEFGGEGGEEGMEREDASMLRALRCAFGMRAFKPGQAEAIRCVMRRQSTLLVLPTGGGKSLTYQLPAFLSTQTTLVVSPLLALISDQLASLPSSLPGLSLSSEQPPQERAAVAAKLRLRDARGAAVFRLLYVAPERLADGQFQSFLLSLPRVAGCGCGAAAAAAAAAGGACGACGAASLPPLGFACVDEAHCVSEWSHNFRPSFLAVGDVLARLGVRTVLGLTATATARTTASICASLRIPPAGVISVDLRRDNLLLSAELTPRATRLERVRQLLQSELSRGEESGSAIVYCISRWEVDEAARELKSRGWRAEAYHAGRAPADRQRIQAAFMSGHVQVVVATVAFGMGVHKENVRLVIHAGLPRSIEAWMQETGRAGRDGQSARCVALVGEGDYRHLHSQCHRDGVDLPQVHTLVDLLLQNASNGYGDLAYEQLETKLDMSREQAQTVLALLAQPGGGSDSTEGGSGGVSEGEERCVGGGDDERGREEGGGDGAGIRLECGRGGRGPADAQEPAIELLPEIRRCAILSFHTEPPDAVAARHPLVAMLLKYAAPSNGMYRCPLVQAASELGMNAHAAHAALCRLHEGGALRLELAQPAFYFRVRRAPTPDEMRGLAAGLAARMRRVESLQRTKLAAVGSLLWQLAEAPSRGCDELLRRYFADQLADGNEWAPPVAMRALPVTLRGDLHDFISRHIVQPVHRGKRVRPAVGDALTGRVIARIFHGMPSPAYPWKMWHTDRSWASCREVDFEVLRQLAEDALETARRQEKAGKLEDARKKRKSKRSEVQLVLPGERTHTCEE